MEDEVMKKRQELKKIMEEGFEGEEKKEAEAKYISNKATFESPDFQKYLALNYSENPPKRLSESGLTYYNVTQENYLRWVKGKKEGDEEIIEEFYTDKDLIDYVPEPQDWLIENQIPKGEVGLLVGKRGERKTFVALYQALCLASKKKVFGEDNVPEKKKILIIDEETGKNAMAQRIAMLKKGLGLKEELDIKYISFMGLKLDQKQTKTYLKYVKIVKDFKPDLIIVDCLQRCVTFEVDKDNAAISELFTDVVRPVIKTYGTSWLFIHHLRKAPATSNYRPEDPLDEVRGGSELVNYCRYVLMCQSPRGQPKTEEGGEMLVFRVLKMSNSPIPDPKVISFTSNDGGLRIVYEGIPEDILSAEVRCANAIKEYLFNKQIIEFQTKDINDASEEIGAKKTFISYGLNILLKQGFLKKIKRGFWKVAGDSQTKLNGENS